MIRLATAADVPEILSIYAPYVENTTVSFEYTVPSLKEFLARFQRITAQFPWLVWEEAGKVLGYAYGSKPFERAGYSWCAEVSIYLCPEAQGKGVGRKLYEVLEKLLEKQGYHLIYSIVTSENKGSLEFHRRLGYEFLAEFPACGYKLGKSLGIVWLQKRLKSVETPKSFPIPFCELVENDGKMLDILSNLTLSES